MKYIIYKHTNIITNKSYIGYTQKSMDYRWDQHVNDALRGSDRHLCRAIRKHGVDKWTHEILYETTSLKEAKLLEMKYIKEYNTLNEGYNMTAGGDGGLGRAHSEEAKQKMSNSQKKFRHTKESKKRMRIKFTKLRGKPVAQYSRDGKYITTFLSSVLAAISLGKRNICGSISQMCNKSFNHNQQLIYGFQWRFCDGSFKDIAPALDGAQLKRAARNAIINEKSKMVEQLSLSNDVLATFKSAKEAAASTGVYYTGINRCCNLKLKTAGGFKWRFKSQQHC